MNIDVSGHDEIQDFPMPNKFDKMQFLIDIRTEKLTEEKNTYQKAKIKRLLNPIQFGAYDDFFGGNVYVVAELKNEKYYLLVNRVHQTIGLCLRLDEVDKFTKSELIEWATLHNIKVAKDETKESIINKLTAKAVHGKINT